jgi:hypothetical protein
VAAAGKDLLSRLVLACLPLFALAGCGSASAPTEDGAADTWRFELVITRTDREGRLVMSGSFDHARATGTLTAKLFGTEAADTDVPTEVRFIGDRYFTQEEFEGKTYWVEEKSEPAVYPNEAIVPFPESGLDPKQALELIRASGDKLQQLGQADVRGTQTTHYRIEVDPERLREHLPPGRRLAQGDPEQDRPFPVEFWADDAERLRRIQIHEGIVGGDSGTLTYEFFDFGVGVDVDRPPSDQIVSRVEFEELSTPTDDEMLELCMEELPKEECEQMHKERDE